MRASHRLTVYGYDVTLQDLTDGQHPLDEAALELLSVQPGEDPAERVVGGNAIGQFQHLAQPSLLAPAERFHVHPTVRTCYGAAERNGEDIDQLVALGAVYTRVDEAAEVFGQRRYTTTRHGSPSL